VTAEHQGVAGVAAFDESNDIGPAASSGLNFDINATLPEMRGNSARNLAFTNSSGDKRRVDGIDCDQVA
jgi:hypothetical protein